MSYYPVFAMEATVVLGPPSRPFSSQDVKAIMDQMEIKIFFSSPGIIEHVASLPGGMENLSNLEYLMYTRGSLSPSVGDRLSQVVQIASFYSSIEARLAPFLMPEREDWQWLEMHPAYRPDMEPDIDGPWELILRKSGDPTSDEMRGTFWTAQGVEEWQTKDLFLPHPVKPGLWKYYGRKDDVMVLSNGEKFNPVPSESIISGHSSLAGVLVVGDNRPQPAVLLEPRDVPQNPTTLAENIQPLIDEANSKVAQQGHIFKATIVKPGSFLRAPKGTVVRKLTADKFRREIDHLYLPV